MEGVAWNMLCVSFSIGFSTCLLNVGLSPCPPLSLSLSLSLSINASLTVCLSFDVFTLCWSRARLSASCTYLFRFKNPLLFISIYYSFPSMSLNLQSQVHTEIKYRLQRFSFGEGSPSLKVAYIHTKVWHQNLTNLPATLCNVNYTSAPTA